MFGGEVALGVSFGSTQLLALVARVASSARLDGRKVRALASQFCLVSLLTAGGCRFAGVRRLPSALMAAGYWYRVGVALAAGVAGERLLVWPGEYSFMPAFAAGEY